MTVVQMAKILVELDGFGGISGDSVHSLLWLF